MSVAAIQEAVHREPVWRDRSNFIIATSIEPDESGMSTEQLWARRVDDQLFELCCIPFFADNLALGDVVEVDSDYIVSRVSTPSGRFVFRIWFGESSHPRNEVSVELDSLGALIEWSSENLLAVDARDAAHAQQIADYLQEQENAGRLMYETGKTA